MIKNLMNDEYNDILNMMNKEYPGHTSSDDSKSYTMWASLNNTLDENSIREYKKEIFGNIIKTKGIHSKVRGKMWRKFIGNRLEITEKTFEDCRKKSQTSHKDEKEEMMIERDTQRMFPKLDKYEVFSERVQKDVKEVLLAYNVYNNARGYISGMPFWVCMLRLNMSAFDTFVCMSNILDGYDLLSSLYDIDKRRSSKYFEMVGDLIDKIMNDKWKVMEGMELKIEMLCHPWMATVFINMFGLSSSMLIFDAWLLKGDIIIIRLCLVLVNRNIKYGDSLEDVMMRLHYNLWRDDQVSNNYDVKIFEAIDDQSLSDQDFNTIMKQHNLL